MADSAHSGVRIRRHLEASAAVQLASVERCSPDIIAAAELLLTAFRAGHKLLLCGNGGSAAQSQHIAAEFANALNHDRPRPALAAMALTTDAAFLTASANDFGFEGIFARQIEALGRRGDVLVAISTSGNSPNVLAALGVARAAELGTILLTGQSGGKAAALADVVIAVPSEATQQIQETHMAVGHLLCALVEDALFPTE